MYPQVDHRRVNKLFNTLSDTSEEKLTSGEENNCCTLQAIGGPTKFRWQGTSGLIRLIPSFLLLPRSWMPAEPVNGISRISIRERHGYLSAVWVFSLNDANYRQWL